MFYQQGRTIFAVEPLTGETLWQRGGIEQTSTLFADEDRLMVVRPNSRVANYYSSADGSVLGSRGYNPGKQTIAASDGKVLSQEYTDGKMVIQWQHLWTEQVLWRREFHQKTLLTRVGDDQIAVLPTAENFQVLSINDGKPVFESPVKIDQASHSITVLPSSDIYTLIVNRRNLRGRPQRFGAPGTLQDLFVSGTVHGIERKTGRVLWSKEMTSERLNLRQPEEMPMLVFAGSADRGRQHQMLLCLDKRTGREIYEALNITRYMRYEADEETHSVQLILLRKTLQFNFTDQTIEADSPDTPNSTKSQPPK